MTRPHRAFANVCAASFILLAPAAHAGGWSVEHVTGGQFQSGDLVLDSLDRPWIIAGSGPMRLTRWDGSTWQTEEIGDACGVSLNLGLNAMDLPTLSFTSLAEGLTIGRFDGSSWTFEVVDPNGDAGALALDRAGNPHLAYYQKLDKDLNYARWTGSQWLIEVVDATDNVGQHVSLRLDAGDNPAISYFDQTNYDLKYARWTGSAWATETVDAAGNLGSYTSLALDRLGAPAISYVDFANRAVKYARWRGSTWSFEVVATATGTPGTLSATSLALDGSDTPSVAYTEYGVGGAVLRLARFDGSTWPSENVFDGAGAWTTLRLDASATPQLASSDSSYASAYVASRVGTFWSVEKVDDAGYVTNGVSIAIEPSGETLISHAQSITRDLHLARSRPAAGWSREVADPSRIVGWNSSLALDPLGFPAISYFDYSNRGIKFARWDGVRWNTETVADVGTSDYYSSLAFDTAGLPAIAFQDSGEVKLARFTGSTWVSEVVDINAFYPSLGFEISGAPALAYRGSTGVLYAWWDGATWRYQTISAAAADRPTLDFHAGEPAVGFVDQRGALNYAHRELGAWVTEMPVTVGAQGLSPLTFDGFGNPNLVYTDTRAVALVLARRNGGAWIRERVSPLRTVVQGYIHPAIATDTTGRPVIAFTDLSCVSGRHLHVARRGAVLLCRGDVAGLGTGWQATALPLTIANDDETPPFPVATELGGETRDALPPNSPLVLYRVLEAGLDDTGNVLRATKDSTTPGAIRLLY